MYISTNLDEERKEKKFKTENYKVQIDNFAVILQKYVFKVIWPEPVK